MLQSRAPNCVAGSGTAASQNHIMPMLLFDSYIDRVFLTVYTVQLVKSSLIQHIGYSLRHRYAEVGTFVSGPASGGVVPAHLNFCPPKQCEYGVF